MLESYYFFRPSERKPNDFESLYQNVYPWRIALSPELPFVIKMEDGELFSYPPETVSYIPIVIGDIQYPFIAIYFWDGDWGKYPYPTPLMLKEIIEIIGEKSVPDFWKWHNEHLSLHAEQLANGETFCTDIYKANYDICRRTGFFWDTYYYYNLIIFYAHSIFWKGIYSIEKQLERDIDHEKALNIYIRTGEGSSQPVGIERVQAKWLDRITDYVRAKDVINQYREMLKSVSMKPDIQKLINKRGQEKLEYKKKVQKTESLYKPPAICQFCGTFIEQATRFPSSCGSDECKRLYEQDRKVRQRGSKTPSGWTAFYQRKACAGCTRRVQLNRDLLCRDCFEESAL